MTNAAFKHDVGAEGSLYKMQGMRGSESAAPESANNPVTLMPAAHRSRSACRGGHRVQIRDDSQAINRRFPTRNRCHCRCRSAAYRSTLPASSATDRPCCIVFTSQSRTPWGFSRIHPGLLCVRQSPAVLESRIEAKTAREARHSAGIGKCGFVHRRSHRSRACRCPGTCPSIQYFVW